MPSDRWCGANRRYGAGPRFVQTRRAALAGLAALLAARPAAAARALKLLCLGDSLTAGYLLPAGQGFAPVLERELRKRGLAVEAIDAGVSGDTATAGAERLDWALGEGADVAVVELGANDMFRGTDPEITRRALDSILTRLKEKRVRPILAGMRASPGLGADYVARFDRIYPELAEKHGVPLYPFFLEGVAGDRALNLPDGIHPTKAGVERIVAGILPLVEAELREAAAG
ncbi:MAG: arylesterase [Methylobacteriaceae bacterium]|nr:arylesterase [Methylobacteriaceae bacterium]